MNLEQLRALGLEKRWPRLTELLREVASFEQKLRKANAEVQQLQAALAPARERDLNAQAQAVRAGKEPPKVSEEQRAEKKLDAVRRDAVILSRALQAVQTDLGAFRAKRQAALFNDVLDARQQIANQLAEHARGALRDFTRWSDLHYVVRDLTPPEPTQENQPAERSTIVYGPARVATTSSGPARGNVEQMLQHLISLGAKEIAEDVA